MRSLTLLLCLAATPAFAGGHRSGNGNFNAGNHGHNFNQFNGQFRSHSHRFNGNFGGNFSHRSFNSFNSFSHVNRGFGVVGVPSYGVGVGSFGVPMAGYGVTQSFGVPAVTTYQTQTYSGQTFGGGFADPNCVAPVQTQTFGLPVAPVTPVVPVPVYTTRPGLLNRFSGALNGFGRGY